MVDCCGDCSSMREYEIVCGSSRAISKGRNVRESRISVHRVEVV